MEGNPGLLPADVLLKIFSYCSYRDLVAFQFVCRWWQQVSRDNHLWRDIVYKPDCRENTKDIIENLRASPELRALHLTDIRCTVVTKELVIEIANACPRLEQLSVCRHCLYWKFHFKINKIKILFLHSIGDNSDFPSQIYLEHLDNCFPNVEHLDCIALDFKGRDFRAYLRKKGESLRTLGIWCEKYPFYEKCILPYLSMCPNLKGLTLSFVCLVIGHLPAESVEHLKQISSLIVKNLGFIVCNNYLSMFRCFPNLLALELHQCAVDNEQELHTIAKNCPLLEKLTLSRSFSDNKLKYVSDFKKLTFLSLRSIITLTDACVAHLQAVSELRYLNISDCYNLTPQCLLPLCSFPKLQSLKFDLQNCDPPADLGASHVKNPDLHIMFYNCKDTSVLDRLRRQRLRISLLNGFSWSNR